jgi:hypothetical protein
MPDIAALIAEYRATLQASEPLAPLEERRSYAHHIQELSQLCSLLSAGAPSSSIAAVVVGERRAFGWSFLSGEHGARVEQAFHLLASALEALHPLARSDENGA